jgi:dienelactone hydrolase
VNHRGTETQRRQEKTVLKVLSSLLCVSVSLWLISSSRAAEPLPNTKPLTEDGDLAAKMVAGIHRYLDRELAAAPAKRDEVWKDALASKEALAKSLPAKRERLRKMLGVVDERVKPNLEYRAGPGKASLIEEIDECKIHRVRWSVLPGVHAEGFLIEPKGQPKANVVYLPGTGAGARNIPYDLELARHGCRVLMPTMIDRHDELSGNAKLKRQTNLPHREFIWRMAYEMGRTLTGYEVQKVLAAVDWFKADEAAKKVGVIGYGDGGMIALYAGALDPRIHTTAVALHFAQRERLHEEPIDHNVWGLLLEFGDAEVARLHNEERLHLLPGSMAWEGPASKSGRGGAAPGRIGPLNVDRDYLPEVIRINGQPREHGPGSLDRFHQGFLTDLGVWVSQDFRVRLAREYPDLNPKPKSDPEYSLRHKRQFDQLVSFTQKLWRDSDAARREFWKKADYKSLDAYEKSTEWYRDYFHTEVIGKLPEPTMPLNPRSRQVYDEEKFTGHEVMLDVYPDVFAYGILLLPKDLKPGEKRPVVVCQHGLEGRPTDTINVEKRVVYNHFSRRLVELGYIVYAPQNPYIGSTTFRQIQRKAQPLKWALFSFIVRQHQRTIDWLETLPNVDPKRIAFYGLSYGGKTAMRVPAIEKRYCLSICSADFNEWVGKCVSVDLDRSYMWTVEYDMYEFDLGHTFNYAEMAFLIAPRPFMVERGHDDGVGIDEMVAYEYAKIRYLYANRLKIPDRTAIEFSPGGHEIFAKGTFAFLKNHLNYP